MKENFNETDYYAPEQLREQNREEDTKRVFSAEDFEDLIGEYSRLRKDGSNVADLAFEKIIEHVDDPELLIELLGQHSGVAGYAGPDTLEKRDRLLKKLKNLSGLTEKQKSDISLYSPAQKEDLDDWN
ncbi:MAG TPA: hypothetical protein P5056_01760 [Candidatus Paceibacterota bacterium]|nr:hypothetical protein [Candidatus Paceibacterota bacterium]